MKKTLCLFITNALLVYSLFAKTNLNYIQSRSHLDLTLTHSFHSNLKITPIAGPLRLGSKSMTSLGFAVKYNYFFHQNLYGILGFAYQNIPTEMHWNLGSPKNYFPEEFADFGLEKQSMHAHYFLNRSFPIGIGTSLIIKQKAHLFLELMLNNVINSDRWQGQTNSFIYYGTRIKFFKSYLGSVGNNKYSPEFGFNIGYASKLKSGDYFKMSLFTNISLTTVIAGDYQFEDLGPGNDSSGLIEYKNNLVAIQMTYTLNYKRHKKQKIVNQS